MDNLDKKIVESLSRESEMLAGHEARFRARLAKNRQKSWLARYKIYITGVAASIIISFMVIELYTNFDKEQNIEINELTELIEYSNSQMYKIENDILSLEDSGIDLEDFAELKLFVANIRSDYEELKESRYKMETSKFKKILYTNVKKNIDITENIMQLTKKRYDYEKNF